MSSPTDSPTPFTNSPKRLRATWRSCEPHTLRSPAPKRHPAPSRRPEGYLHLHRLRRGDPPLAAVHPVVGPTPRHRPQPARPPDRTRGTTGRVALPHEHARVLLRAGPHRRRDSRPPTETRR